MNTTRMAILGGALLCGTVCVGVLVHGLSAAKPRAVVAAAPAPPPPPVVHILVATRDLPVGEHVQVNDMRWQELPVAELDSSYITDGVKPASTGGQGKVGAAVGKLADMGKTAMSDPSKGPGAQFVGAVVREHILINQPIVAGKLVHAGGSGVLAVTLDPGMRAVALPLTPESAAGGFVQPGDHVDVLMTRSAEGPVQQLGASNPMHGFITTVVMRNVKVLAIDQNMGAQKTASTIGATATVQATPRQAQYLVLAKASGTLTLALRSYADTAGGAEVGEVERNDGEPMTVRVFRDGAATPVTVNR